MIYKNITPVSNFGHNRLTAKHHFVPCLVCNNVNIVHCSCLKPNPQFFKPIKIKRQFILVLFWVNQIHIILRCSYLDSACTEWPLPNDKREKTNVLKLTHSNLQSHAIGNFSSLEIELPTCEVEWCNRITSFILKSYSWYQMLFSSYKQWGSRSLIG